MSGAGDNLARTGELSRRKRRRGWLWFWVVYALLAIASNLVVREAPTALHPAPLSEAMSAVAIPDFADNGDAGARDVRLAYRSWGAVGGEALVLIHGSPGSSGDFSRLGPALAARGHWVIAPDMPGFGESERRPASYSVRTHARGVLALMDSLGVPRAHLLGWSMGGGVVLNMAELAPERVASVTMLAAIGDQRTEGSGSYAFEHAKYALGERVLRALHVLTPHFGLLPNPRGTVMYSLMRNFGDTDQRPLTGIMERLETRTLIIAGAHDFLVPLRATELQHRLIRPSRLVVLDAMHFMPFLQVEETAELVDGFVRSGVVERGAEYRVRPAPPPLGVVGRTGVTLLHGAPWWAPAALLALLAWRRPYLASAVMAALVNALALDWGVGLLGVWAGVAVASLGAFVTGVRHPGRGVSLIDWSRRFERSPAGFWWAVRSVFRPDIRETGPRAAGALGSAVDKALFVVGAGVGSAAWTLVACLPLLLIAALLGARLRAALGWAGTGVTLLALWLWARSFFLVFTWTGRRMLLARLARSWRHEYWPSWIYYAPLGVYMAFLSLRHRHPLAFSACNPGIEGGGGLIGESKFEVQSCVRDEQGVMLPAVLIPDGIAPEERAALALRHIGPPPPPGTGVGGFPVILKPDAGLRGFAVRLARSAPDVEAYLRSMTRPAILQRYHAGPHEVGVMWARRVDGVRNDTGFIYSITRKDFPYVQGDGRRTLEELIYRHPRHRRQAGTFLARFADDASRVVPSGERVRLAQSGNHCQGTLFRDGADLATPELERALGRLSFTFAETRFPGPDTPGGLDVVRYDLRFESEEELRAGRGFGVVEINGTTGESTNIYDPEKSLLWSYRVLFGQWRLLYELGAWRRSRGVQAWSIPMLLRSLRRFYRGRPGSSVAD